MKPLSILSVLAVALVVVGLGNMLNSPASTPCDNGQCTIPEQAVTPPVVEPGTPAVCDGDCATCPNVTCPENPQYSEPAESCDDGACRAPLRKAGKAVIKAPIKTVGSAGRIAVKPLKVFRLLRRR